MPIRFDVIARSAWKIEVEELEVAAVAEGAAERVPLGVEGRLGHRVDGSVRAQPEDAVAHLGLLGLLHLALAGVDPLARDDVGAAVAVQIPEPRDPQRLDPGAVVSPPRASRRRRRCGEAGERDPPRRGEPRFAEALRNRDALGSAPALVDDEVGDLVAVDVEEGRRRDRTHRLPVRAEPLVVRQTAAEGRLGRESSSRKAPVNREPVPARDDGVERPVAIDVDEEREVREKRARARQRRRLREKR